jgi:hypothetical protein
MPEIPVESATLFQNSITELEQAESALELAWNELEKQTAETIAQHCQSRLSKHTGNQRPLGRGEATAPATSKSNKTSQLAAGISPRKLANGSYRVGQGISGSAVVANGRTNIWLECSRSNR